LVLAISVVAIACAPAAPATTPKPATSAPAATTAAPAPATTAAPAAFKWPELTNIAGGPAETAGYAAAVAWVSLMQKGTGANVRVVPAEQSPATWRGVQNGQYLMFADAPPSFSGIIASEGGFATKDGGTWQMRMVWPSSKSVTGYFVRGNSNINTPLDIKPGAKLGFLTAAPIAKVAMQALVAWAGLKDTDVEYLPYPDWQSMWDAVPAGKIDITFAMPAAPGVQQVEASPTGIKWIQLDFMAQKDGANRFLAVLPTFAPGVNDMGAKTSIGMKGLATISTWVTREQTDPELIYQMVKWLGSNYDAIKALNPYLVNYSLPITMEAVNTTFLPAHPGLIKYLKEAGKWTAANDARQAANVDMVTKYVNAYQAALKAAEAKGISIDSKADSDWTKFWTQYKKDQNLPVIKSWPGL
jgi:hypothetical protein